MNMETIQEILNKIRAYDRIMLFRHFRPDGDAKGSTKGLQQILRLSFPEKQIHLINDDHSDYLAFLGDDEPEVSEELYREALAIVLDTATTARISNPKFSLCREVIKIDHHIPVEDYGTINWVEEERSSVCEMVAHFYATFRDTLKIDSHAAMCLYTGMVTDSGRFQYSSTGGDTMRCAGLLLDVGFDTDLLYARLNLHDPQELKFKAYVYRKMKITENGVAYVHIDRAAQEKFQLTAETASSCVGFMDSLRGCLCWIAFIDNCDEADTIRVRLRSRFAPINTVAEHYRGGGHACACGATLHSRREMRPLLREADALIRDYKQTHEDWL